MVRRGYLTGRSPVTGETSGEIASGDAQGSAWRGATEPADSWAPSARSGWEWQGTQSGQCAAELVFPVPALGKMQGEAPGLAGKPSGQGEET